MKPLRRKRGFTLAEMLIAVLLLGFVSIMVAVMSSSVLNSTVMMKEVAQAEILGSEALDNVQGELRFAQNVTVDSAKKSVVFDIDSNNKGYTMAVNEGRIVLRHTVDSVEVDDLLFAGVSYGNLQVSKLDFTLTEDKTAVEIAVAVSYGEKVLWSSEVAVKPLNGITGS